MNETDFFIWLKKECIYFFAKCIWLTASITANSACFVPFFEPDRPKELERLKKKH